MNEKKRLSAEYTKHSILEYLRINSNNGIDNRKSIEAESDILSMVRIKAIDYYTLADYMLISSLLIN